MHTTRKTGKSTVLKHVACGLLAFLAADLQAQLLYKTKFSAVEGYTNGWMIGQPSIGTPWQNANADPSGAPGGFNNGYSLYTNGASYLMVTATNTSAPGGGAMMVASDGNLGTNTSVYYWRMPFPKTLVGPITVTWDWQFFPTNPIPADYDPTNKPYNNFATYGDPVLLHWDEGFTLADSANAMFDGDPNVVFNELSCPTRLSDQADSRYNALAACGGGGSWYNLGPEFKDGKKIHAKMVAYVGLTGDAAATNNSFSVWSQRTGEDLWQTAYADGSALGFPDWGMRRCPGETDPTSGINCITMWMNSSVEKYLSYVQVSNIRVVGPNPVAVPNLSIDKTGKVTFDGWLEAADSPSGPYTTVAVQSPYQAPAGASKFYRASN